MTRLPLSNTQVLSKIQNIPNESAYALKGEEALQGYKQNVCVSLLYRIYYNVHDIRTLMNKSH